MQQEHNITFGLEISAKIVTIFLPLVSQIIASLEEWL